MVGNLSALKRQSLKENQLTALPEAVFNHTALTYVTLRGNARFLIVPAVRVQNLASHVLARVARRLPRGWNDAYGYTPVVIETFVQTGRFTGESYKAANWIHVGKTKGRGKLDRSNSHALPVKDVYLYPLHRDYRHILASPASDLSVTGQHRVNTEHM